MTAPAPTYTPESLARALDLPAPTPDQAAVIAAPLGPVAVVAGAGSGKTETMAARVVYLVANGIARPEEILGLTFTRKAARELAGRIRRRLAQLRDRGLVDQALDGEAEVSTYDAYAGRLVAEHAVRLGREPNPRLLSPAMVFQLAESVLLSYDGPMDRVARAPSTVLTAMLDLQSQIAGHLVDHDRIRDEHRALELLLRSLPKGPRQRNDLNAELARIVEASAGRAQLVGLVAALDEAKRTRESVDFAEQAALAARLALACPEVGEGERGRYRAVLLDEYQDTSFNQLTLLRALFGGGHPVLAVGDPMQSIYSWRGASVGTLGQFVRDFPGEGGDPAVDLPLAVSFRNRRTILAAANALTAELRAADARVTVPELTPYSDEPGEVRVGLYADADGEIAAVADQLAAVWHEDAPQRAVPGGKPRTLAVLLRKRARMTDYADALRARGVETEIVGLGGLLYAPAVADVYATLRVMADPSDGAALMRLLTGSRWRLGSADIHALGRYAAQQNHDADDGAPQTDGTTIVDAVAEVADVQGLTAEGKARIKRIGTELDSLHDRAAAPLPDLVAEVIRRLGLDVEVAARTGDVVGARADLDAFQAAAAEFSDSAEDARLSSFLAFLAAAEDAEEGLEKGHVQVSPHRAQVITVHGAKGLEWDVVAVPSMCQEIFPAAPKSVNPARTMALLPFELRGDADHLPRLDFGAATDQSEAATAAKDFDAQCKGGHAAEERRLAYVAVTRARALLLCTGYLGDDTVKEPRAVSAFLDEIREACEGLPGGTVLTWAEAAPEVPPEGVPARTATWPYDELGERRAVVEQGAALVRAALAELPTRGEAAVPGTEVDLSALNGPDGPVRWRAETDLVLADLARRRQRADVRVELPGRLSVSQLVELRRDPQALARRLRRPVPAAPNPQARRGTAFHAWLEQQYGQPALLDVVELPGSADDGSVDDDNLRVLQEAFRASVWAARTPLEVEAPFDLVLDGTVVRGRADAVFPGESGGVGRRRGAAQPSLFDEPAPAPAGHRPTIEVVDWKTGRPPRGAAAKSAAVQLAAYRLAFAHLYGLDLHQVSAAFHYVADNTTVRPSDLLDADGLLELLHSVAEDEPDEQEHRA